jgi:hypothetical protein
MSIVYMPLKSGRKNLPALYFKSLYFTADIPTLPLSPTTTTAEVAVSLTVTSKVEIGKPLEILDPTHRGLHRFIPRHPDEIEVDIGDPVYVQKEAEDLWCEGIIIMFSYDARQVCKFVDGNAFCRCLYIMPSVSNPVYTDTGIPVFGTPNTDTGKN